LVPSKLTKKEKPILHAGAAHHATTIVVNNNESVGVLAGSSTDASVRPNEDTAGGNPTQGGALRTTQKQVMAADLQWTAACTPF